MPSDIQCQLCPARIIGPVCADGVILMASIARAVLLQSRNNMAPRKWLPTLRLLYGTATNISAANGQIPDVNSNTACANTFSRHLAILGYFFDRPFDCAPMLKTVQGLLYCHSIVRQLQDAVRSCGFGALQATATKCHIFHLRVCTAKISTGRPEAPTTMARRRTVDTPLLRLDTRKQPRKKQMPSALRNLPKCFRAWSYLDDLSFAIVDATRAREVSYNEATFAKKHALMMYRPGTSTK
ncbi:hypothetical protein BC835DRAFT_1310127 [Cytidiella melzeri]|nr:hypothetical protein BC835DRAFT_1310127 [Cytidiella melzeri]